jgi:thymidylate kinase
LAHQRIGKRGDEVNEFEKLEGLERCREIFMTVVHEPFVHVIDASGDFDQVADRMRETVVKFIKDQR